MDLARVHQEDWLEAGEVRRQDLAQLQNDAAAREVVVPSAVLAEQHDVSRARIHEPPEFALQESFLAADDRLREQSLHLGVVADESDVSEARPPSTARHAMHRFGRDATPLRFGDSPLGALVEAERRLVHVDAQRPLSLGDLRFSEVVPLPRCESLTQK